LLAIKQVQYLSFVAMAFCLYIYINLFNPKKTE